MDSQTITPQNNSEITAKGNKSKLIIILLILLAILLITVLGIYLSNRTNKTNNSPAENVNSYPVTNPPEPPVSSPIIIGEEEILNLDINGNSSIIKISFESPIGFNLINDDFGSYLSNEDMYLSFERLDTDFITALDNTQSIQELSNNTLNMSLYKIDLPNDAEPSGYNNWVFYTNDYRTESQCSVNFGGGADNGCSFSSILLEESDLFERLKVTCGSNKVEECDDIIRNLEIELVSK